VRAVDSWSVEERVGERDSQSVSQVVKDASPRQGWGPGKFKEISMLATSSAIVRKGQHMILVEWRLSKAAAELVVVWRTSSHLCLVEVDFVVVEEGSAPRML